ncbi:hypothetical protein C5167_042793 [Papaver somniferum]|uniref:Uncharacterized protein n=1 Tax=Papaver somniferum TaxID=3469 RepID=A0A4Y7L7R1_PAPSO|nr:hypothetical protein C5167_042793 [Papaver somniferum]
MLLAKLSEGKGSQDVTSNKWKRTVACKLLAVVESSGIKYSWWGLLGLSGRRTHNVKKTNGDLGEDGESNDEMLPIAGHIMKLKTKSVEIVIKDEEESTDNEDEMEGDESNNPVRG